MVLSLDKFGNGAAEIGQVTGGMDVVQGHRQCLLFHVINGETMFVLGASRCFLKKLCEIWVESALVKIICNVTVERYSAFRLSAPGGIPNSWQWEQTLHIRHSRT